MMLAERTGAKIRKSLESYSASYLRFVWALAATVLIMTYSLWAFQIREAHHNSVWSVISIVPTATRDQIEQDAARSIRRITGAPAVIVVCLTMEDMDDYPDARRAIAEHQMAVQGTAMAIQNMLLAAHAAGLGASVMCAPLFCAATVRGSLALPAHWEPQALVTMGYPADPGKPFRRRLLRDVVCIMEG